MQPDNRNSYNEDILEEGKKTKTAHHVLMLCQKLQAGATDMEDNVRTPAAGLQMTGFR